MKSNVLATTTPRPHHLACICPVLTLCIVLAYLLDVFTLGVHLGPVARTHRALRNANGIYGRHEEPHRRLQGS